VDWALLCFGFLQQSWGVNRHTARCTSYVSLVWLCKLVSGPCGSRSTLPLLTYLHKSVPVSVKKQPMRIFCWCLYVLCVRYVSALNESVLHVTELSRMSSRELTVDCLFTHVIHMLSVHTLYTQAESHLWSHACSFIHSLQSDKLYRQWPRFPSHTVCPVFY